MGVTDTINTAINTLATLEGGERRVNREWYQHGSVRKVPHSQGFA
jgi:hypothetical protein